MQLKIQEFMALAEAADQSAHPEVVNLSEEILRQGNQLAAIAAAKVKIGTHIVERFGGERAEHQARLAVRAGKDDESGKKPDGRGLESPQAGRRVDKRISLTDEGSPIMPVLRNGFELRYYALAAVDTEPVLLFAAQNTEASYDKKQIEPMLAKVQANPEYLHQSKTGLAKTSYYSEKSVAAYVAVKIKSLIAVKRAMYYFHWRKRFSESKPLAEDASAVAVLRYRLKTWKGRAVPALRKQTVQHVFGILKPATGVRQSLLRRLNNMAHAWALTSSAWNSKRLTVLRPY